VAPQVAGESTESRVANDRLTHGDGPTAAVSRRSLLIAFVDSASWQQQLFPDTWAEFLPLGVKFPFPQDLADMRVSLEQPNPASADAARFSGTPERGRSKATTRMSARSAEMGFAKRRLGVSGNSCCCRAGSTKL